MEKIRVLVVDDEFGIRAGITRILSKFEVDYPFMESAIKFELIEVETGENAIDLLKSSNFDIVLLDNKLPGIQGVEVLNFINENDIETMVIMITSYASLELAVKATSQGAIDFVPKPFTPQELKASIENITKQIFLKEMAQGLHREGKQIKFKFLSLLSLELKKPIDEVSNCLLKVQNKELGNNISEYIPIIEKSLDKLNNMRAMITDLMALTNTNVKLSLKTIEKANIKDFVLFIYKLIYYETKNNNIKLYLNSDVNIDYKFTPIIFELIYNNIIKSFIVNTNNTKFIDCTIETNDFYSTLIFKNSGNPNYANLIKEADIANYNVESFDSNRLISGPSLNLANKLYEDYGITINLTKNEIDTELVISLKK